MKYREGYKYQVYEDYSVKIAISPREDIETHFLALKVGGMLTMKRGYAWDGPSGPTIDTKNFMRGSLVHDALFQLIRMGLLAEARFHAANVELRRMCLEDGMSRLRAWYVWRSVESFGRPAAEAGNTKPVLEAP